MSVTVIATNTPRARKPHCCEVCTHAIAKGETYHQQVCVYDGRVYSWRTHTHCAALAAAAWTAGYREHTERMQSGDDVIEWLRDDATEDQVRKVAGDAGLALWQEVNHA